MPNIRPGWTIIQSFDLRVGAIAYLCTLERRTSVIDFLESWWDFWERVHGVPDPVNWDEVADYELYLSEYRRRVFRTIRWHACGGRQSPMDSRMRMNRIRRLRHALLQDLAHYERLGLDFNSSRSAPDYEPLFEDSIRGYSLVELGLRSHAR